MSGQVIGFRGGGASGLVECALRCLRDEGRRAVRIVDVECGTGRRLAGVVRLARAMGFTAIEARGCTNSPEAAAAAQAARARRPDAVTGWSFDAADAAKALGGERAGGDADLILAPAPVEAVVRGAVAPVGRTRRIRAAAATRPAPRRSAPVAAAQGRH